MIDINELREKITIKGLDVVADTDVLELLDRLEAAEKERDALRALVVMRFDQDHPPQFTQGYDTHELTEPVTAEHCRWFVDEIERLRAEVAHIKEVEFPRKAQAVAAGWRGKLEAAEKERETDERRIADLMADLNRVGHENDDLRAKIEQMEKQEPVWFIDERGEPKRYHKSKADYCKYGGLDLLYALPGAKGVPKC